MSRAKAASQPETIVLPIVEEELEVQKRVVESGGVRIHKTVREREEVVETPLLYEEVSVERVPVNRVVDGKVEVRYEGDTMIVPVVEEVLVVEKRLMLKEELHVTRKRLTRTESKSFTLKSEDALVERMEPDAANRSRNLDRASGET